MANIIVAQLLYLDAVDPKKVCSLPFLFFNISQMNTNILLVKQILGLKMLIPSILVYGAL